MGRSALEDHHLAPADLARRENVGVETVYAWNRDGTGPRYMRIGKHARYRLADVESWENGRYVAHSQVVAS